MSLNRYMPTRRRKSKKTNRRRVNKQQVHNYDTLEPRQLLAVDFGINATVTQFGVGGVGSPPDAHGAVGPAHVVEVTNGRYKVFNKTDGSQLLDKPIDSFWRDTGGAGAEAGDAFFTGGSRINTKVTYDAESRRWFITSVTTADIITGLGGNQNGVLLAVSRTSNPLQDWTSVQNIIDINNNGMIDAGEVLRGGWVIPASTVEMGVDAHAVYLNIDAAGTVNVVSKDNLVVPNPAVHPLLGGSLGFLASPGTDTQFAMNTFGTGTGTFGLTANPGGGNSILLSEISDPELGGGASMEPTISIPVDPYSAPPIFVRQEFDPDLVNSAASFTANVVRVDNSLWAVHAIMGSSGNNTAVRWYEVDLDTKTVAQSGTIEDPAGILNYIYPSIAVTTTGRAAIGFTATGIGLFPSAWVSAGYTDNGVMTFEDPVAIKDGDGGYFDTRGNFWGRYSSTRVDADDPSKLWTFQMWSDGSENGFTQMTELNLIGLSPSVLGTGGDNTIIVRRSAFDPAEIEVEIDGIVVAAHEEAALYELFVDGGGGNDTFILDTVNGELNLPRGVQFIGDGDDTVRLDTPHRSNWEIERDGAGVVAVGTDLDPVCDPIAPDVVTFQLNFEPGSGWFDTTPWNQGGYATFGDALRGELQAYFDDVIAPIFTGTFTVEIDINDDEVDSAASARALDIGFYDVGGQQVLAGAPWAILTGRGDPDPTNSDGVIDYNLDLSLYGNDRQALLDNVVGGLTRHEFWHVLGMDTQLPNHTNVFDPRGLRTTATVMDINYFDVNDLPLLGNYNSGDMTFEILPYTTNLNWSGDNSGIYFLGIADDGSPMPLVANSNADQIDFYHLASSFAGTSRSGPWGDVIEQDRAFLRGLGYVLNPVNPPIPSDGNPVFFTGVDQIIGGLGVDHFCARSVNVDIEMQGRDGNDSFVLLGTGVGAIDFLGGAGDDYYEINTSSASVITVSDSVAAENDRMVVLGTASNDLFVFDTSGVDINAGRLLYTGIEDINFLSQDGDDTFEIKSSNVGTAKLDGGIGNDLFLVNDQGTGGNLNTLSVSKVNTTTNQVQLDITAVITDTYLADNIENLSVEGTYIFNDFGNGTPTVAGGFNLLGNGDESLVMNSTVAANWLINGDGTGVVTMDVDPMTFMGLMSIDGSQGIDVFDVQMTNTDLAIRSRGDDDAITINNAGTGILDVEGNLDNDLIVVMNSGGGVFVAGNDGDDTIVIDDSGPGATSATGGTGMDTFNVLNSGSLNVFLDGEDDRDTFNINNTGSAMLTIEGGMGNDLFNVINSGLGDTDLFGESGDDTYIVANVDASISFNIVDSISMENDTFVSLGTANADSIFLSDIAGTINAGNISFIGIETFVIDGLAGNDTIQVDLSPGWNGSLNVNGNDGDDLIEILGTGMGLITVDGGNDNDSIQVFMNSNSNVIVNDAGGIDTLGVHGTLGVDLFTLTATMANVSGGIITYTGLESAVFDGRDASDTFDINSAIDNSTYRGGMGNDIFNVNTTANNAMFFGDGGADTFNVFNSSSLATFNGGDQPDLFNVFVASGPATFNGDAGDDLFNIEQVTGTTNYHGGTGVDIFNVTNHLPLGTPGLINIDGDSGRNRLTVNGYQTQANNVVVTSNSITGMSGVPINYTSTGGSFSINGANGGITLIGSNNHDDSFLVSSFQANNSLVMQGQNGNETFEVQSAALGAIESDGGEGSDTYRYDAGSTSNRFLFARDSGVTGTDRFVVTTTNGDDNLLLSGEVFRVDTDTVVFNQNFESLIIDLAAGNDSVNVNRMNVGFLRLIGRSGNENIVVNDFTGVTGGLLIQAGDGEDTINARTSSVANFMQAYGGNGNDTIIVGSAFYGNSIVDGQAGSDDYQIDIADRSSRFVVARDSGTTGLDTLNINGTILDDLLTLRSGVVRTPNQMVLYNENTEVLNVDTGAARDNISVFGISAPNTNIQTGSEKDLFFVHSTFGNQPAKTLNVNLGTGNDSAVVRGTNSDTITNLAGGDGDDLFNIGSSLIDNNGNLDVIQGLVNVDGGVGNDRIYMNDRGKTASFNYRIDPTSIRQITTNPNPFFGGVDYLSVETLRLDATDFRNRIEVRGSADTSYRFVGNLGLNEILLDPIDAATDGRQLIKTSAVDGFWTFTNGKRDVFFENFFVI